MQSKKAKELYRVKLEKYKDKIDDLTLQQRMRLFRMLWQEAIIETKIEALTAESSKLLNAERMVE